MFLRMPSDLYPTKASGTTSTISRQAAAHVGCSRKGTRTKREADASFEAPEAALFELIWTDCDGLWTWDKVDPEELCPNLAHHRTKLLRR